MRRRRREPLWLLCPVGPVGDSIAFPQVVNGLRAAGHEQIGMEKAGDLRRRASVPARRLRAGGKAIDGAASSEELDGAVERVLDAERGGLIIGPNYSNCAV